ncbi:MAG TPA: hypothetical protein VJV78_43285 [Polyangiales bacterium]|nr:hypothetical protein [Polyangiales bacterium]
MKQFTLDLRQANRVDPNILSFKTVVGAPRQRLAPEVKPALKAALELGRHFDSKIALMDDVASLSFGASATVLRPATAPAAFALSSSAQLTMAVGVTGWGFAIYGAGASAGVYGSTTREIGGYLTLGAGIFIPGLGLSGGGEFTVILGTPLDLSGPYLSAGVSVAPNVFGIGAALLFSPGPPLTLMGICVSLTANTPSAVPLTISLEVTNTKIKPFLRF